MKQENSEIGKKVLTDGLDQCLVKKTFFFANNINGTYLPQMGPVRL